jgi:hypothetical protein
MDNLPLVSMGQPAGSLNHVTHCRLGGNPLADEQFGQRTAVDVLHDQVVQTADLAAFVGVDDMLVIASRG